MTITDLTQVFLKEVSLKNPTFNIILDTCTSKPNLMPYSCENFQQLTLIKSLELFSICMKYNIQYQETFTNTLNLKICFLQDAGIPYNAVTEGSKDYRYTESYVTCNLVLGRLLVTVLLVALEYKEVSILT